MGMYMGISIVYTAIVEYLCKIFWQAKRLIIVIIVGAVTFGVALIASKEIGFGRFVTEVGIYLGLISCVLIPTVLLIIAKVKKYGT